MLIIFMLLMVDCWFGNHWLDICFNYGSNMILRKGNNCFYHQVWCICSPSIGVVRCQHILFFFFFFFFEKVLKRQLIYEIHGNLSSWTIKLSDSYYTHKNIKKSHGHFRQKTPQPFIYKTLPLQPRATSFPFFYFAASP